MVILNLMNCTKESVPTKNHQVIAKYGKLVARAAGIRAKAGFSRLDSASDSTELLVSD
jgi:hypothetical protein